MNPTITYLAAQAHINDMRREAEQARRVAKVRRPRRIKLARPRARARVTDRAATA